MDVTSLLNESADVKVPSREATPSSCGITQEKKSLTPLPTPSPDRTPPRQDKDRDWESTSSKPRKPWNAGGYSLPLQNELKDQPKSEFSSRTCSENLESDASYESPVMDRHSRTASVDSTSADLEAPRFSLPLPQIQQGHPGQWEDHSSSGAGPDRKGHKFSDSHSSLSSFASWRSRSHSRMSSSTTLSGMPVSRQSTAELPSMEPKMASGGEAYQSHSSSNRIPLTGGGGRPGPSHQYDGRSDPRRRGSPPDALLKMRGLKPPFAEAPTSDPSAGQRPFSISSKAHKRAISAPDFRRAGNYRPSRQLPSVLPPLRGAMAIAEDEAGLQNAVRAGEGYGSRSQGDFYGFEGAGRPMEHRDGAPGVSAPRPAPRPVSPSAAAPAPFGYEQQSGRAANMAIPLDEDDEEEKPVCMFVDDCDTGSQLRKAISHLFGRNKTCTLKIPKMVWVYYCRKHYQRVRYRNARTYPVTQMELVETQIERLKAWSDQNQARGKGAYIKAWTLSLRKREEKRLQGNKGGNEEDDDPAAVGSNHIPAWIIDELGDGLDTDRMFSVAARLREEIESGTLSQVPEIEFLPDIVDDESEKDSAKPIRHRRQAASMSVTKTPKRKASDYGELARQSPSYGDMAYSVEVDERGIPSGKRPRHARAATFSHVRQASMPALHHHGHHPHHHAGHTPPSYMGAHGYGHPGPHGAAGAPRPPRAQNVVPKMQPMEYSHPAYPHGPAHAGRREHMAASSQPGGHGRTASYSHESRYSHDGHFQYHPSPPPGQEGQQPRSQFSSRHSSPKSPPITLPSISAHMQGGGGPGYHQPAVPRHGGLLRPLHQRSASAFTPGSREMPLGGRPTSFGPGTPPERIPYEAEPRGTPPPSVLRRPGPRTSGEAEWRHRHHEGRRELSPEYEHTAGPQHPHQHLPYIRSPKYGQTGMSGGSFGSPAGGKNNLSVYPEPVAQLECRSS